MARKLFLICSFFAVLLMVLAFASAAPEETAEGRRQNDLEKVPEGILEAANQEGETESARGSDTKQPDDPEYLNEREDAEEAFMRKAVLSRMLKAVSANKPTLEEAVGSLKIQNDQSRGDVGFPFSFCSCFCEECKSWGIVFDWCISACTVSSTCGATIECQDLKTCADCICCAKSQCTKTGTLDMACYAKISGTCATSTFFTCAATDCAGLDTCPHCTDCCKKACGVDNACYTQCTAPCYTSPYFKCKPSDCPNLGTCDDCTDCCTSVTSTPDTYSTCADPCRTPPDQRYTCKTSDSSDLGSCSSCRTNCEKSCKDNPGSDETACKNNCYGTCYTSPSFSCSVEDCKNLGTCDNCQCCCRKACRKLPATEFDSCNDACAVGCAQSPSITGCTVNGLCFPMLTCSSRCSCCASVCPPSGTGTNCDICRTSCTC